MRNRPEHTVFAYAMILGFVLIAVILAYRAMEWAGGVVGGWW